MKFFLIALTFVSLAAFAESGPDTQKMDTVVVQDVQEKAQRTGVLKDSIQKTEVVTAKTIEKKQAKTVAEAIENEPGIDATNNCSICGIKRVQINGLKGEYTTVLMDDIPLSSTVSSYYGFDAMVTAGVARIEVARGAGASLIAPEAIGGVINIITKKATENSLAIDASGGNAVYRTLSLVGTAVSKDGTQRATISAQHSNQDQWDADGNGVNESPRRANYSVLARLSDDLGVNTNLDLRLSALKASTFGGPMGGDIFRTAIQTTPVGFEGNDVRNKYIGGPNSVNESVELDRLEGAARLTQLLGTNTTMSTTLSLAQQKQDSFYEGNDYAHTNDIVFGDVRLGHQLFTDHLISFGGDVRLETLRSRSYRYYTVLGVPKDDFDYFSPGAYLQDTWTPFDNFELSVAGRFNYIEVDWKNIGVGKEIKRAILVPRAHAKLTHFPELISRLSYGMGYRAPLTFFESEHGILDTGFDVNITAVESSQSANYSLAYDDKKTAATLSGAFTSVTNMSYIDTTGVRPALKNDTGTANAGAADLLVSHQFFPFLQLGASYEHFFYSNRYKGLLPVAAIEDRVRLLADFEMDGWEGNVTVNFVAGRDLAPYNYGNRFNVWDGVTASSPKGTSAPAFATVDLRVAKKINNEISFYAGVKNLFDYTQTKRESPLYFDAAGNLDVIHIWGPLRGRQIYAGLQAKF